MIQLGSGYEKVCEYLQNLYQAMPYLFKDLKVSSFFSGIGAFEKGLDRLYAEIQ